MSDPVCSHCNRKKANRPRGLCWNCYYTPGVREQYGAEKVSKYNRYLYDPDEPLDEAEVDRKAMVWSLKERGLGPLEIAEQTGIDVEEVRRLGRLCPEGWGVEQQGPPSPPLRSLTGRKRRKTNSVRR